MVLGDSGARSSVHFRRFDKMAAESGGIGAKLGGQYERRYACEQLLYLISGRLRRLRWEPPSSGRGGADVELEHDDGVVESVQLKRQNRTDAGWSVAALDREDVLSAAARTLSQPGTRYTFVSADPVPHLKDVCDQLARSTDTPQAFVSLHVHTNAPRRAVFETLLQRWQLDLKSAAAVETAIGRLRSIRFILLDRSEDGLARLLLFIQQTISGDPDEALGLLTTFLEDRLGRDVLQQELLEFLAKHNRRPRDLARDPSVPSTLLDLRAQFRQELRDRLVAGEWIPRQEVGAALDLLCRAAAPRVVLVHGKAGVGKSAVLLGIVEGLIERGVPVLPVSLSARPPDGSGLHRYGEALGLHASPVAALRATAGGNRTVLLLDQLDALRLTTPAAAGTWETCRQMMAAAVADPQTVLVAACRTFDLENDVNIRRWKENVDRVHPNGVTAIHVGDLTAPDIASVLRSIGVEYAALPGRMQKLLLHPSTLDAWFRMAVRGSRRSDYLTQTQLLAALIETLRREASRIHQLSDASVENVLDRTREEMERTGRLAVRASVFDDCLRALDACCSAGLLVRSPNSVAFPHQSYFDHLVARSAIRASGGSPAAIINWVKVDQSLQRRDQLRQLLFVMREENPEHAASVVDRLLTDNQVRFHLKQLVLGVLREGEPVTAADVELVVRLARTEVWADHVRTRLLWGSVTWFDALYAKGAWAAWLADSRADVQLEWLRPLVSVMKSRPAEVDDLLGPVLGSLSPETRHRVLPYDPAEDSPRVAALRDAEVRRGRWALHDITLERLAERDGERALRLLASAIRGAIRRGAAAEFEESAAELRVRTPRDKIMSAVRTRSPEYARLFGRLLRVSERVGAATKTRLESHDSVRRFKVSSSFRAITDVATTITAEAVASLAGADPAAFDRILNGPECRRSEALAVAVAVGLARAPALAADASIAWLCADEDRLELRETFARDKRGLAADIIQRHAAWCSDQALQLLQSRLLRYFPVSEKEAYRFWREERPQDLARGHPVGRGQQLLLAAIPEGRRSPPVQQRLATWNTKFGGPPVEDPDVEIGGWVGSPIPRDRLGRIPDRQWLEIVTRRWTRRRRRQVGPDRIAEASAETFANDFGECAKESPARFVRLALRFPPEAPAVFVSRLWTALGDAGTDISVCATTDLDALVGRTIGTGDREAIVSACNALTKHSDLRWGGMIWRLLGIAAAHEEPRPGEYTVFTQGGGEQRTDLEATAISCVRGVAGWALGALAWGNAERAAQAMVLASSLATDPHPSVRIAAARAALGIYTTDKDGGAELLLKLIEHPEDRILAAAAIRELVRYVRWSHPGRLQPLFERMVRSADAAVAEAGAVWVTAEHFQAGARRVSAVMGGGPVRRFLHRVKAGWHRWADTRSRRNRSLHRFCVKGSPSQRIGVARVLGQLLDDDAVETRAVESALAPFFDDPDPEVRGVAAAVFHDEEVLSTASGARLAARFVRSAAFIDDADSLMRPLAHTAVELPAYAPVVLAAADRFARELAPETRSIQHRLGLAGRDISALLLRLYDAAGKAGDSALASSCLDRWDALLANRVGEAEAHLESFES